MADRWDLYAGRAARRVDQLISMERVESARSAGRLPFGPAGFYRFVSAYMMALGRISPSKSFGQRVCDEYGLSPQDLGNIGVFLTSSPSGAQRGEPDSQPTDASYFIPDAPVDLSGKDLHAMLSMHLLETASVLGAPNSIIFQWWLFGKKGGAGAGRGLDGRRMALNRHTVLGRLRELAHTTGHGVALLEVGLVAETEGRYQEAKALFLRAGDVGVSDGYAHAGRLFNAVGGDRARAEELWRFGAESLDNARCYGFLANLLREDHPDYERLMTKAAASGIPNAAYNLGNFLLNKKKDRAMAKEWFMIAAACDDESADFALINLKTVLQQEGRIGDLLDCVEVSSERALRLTQLELGTREEVAKAKKAAKKKRPVP